MSLGQLSHVGIGKETDVWGTGQAATNYLKFVSESLTLGIEELIEAAINARRDEGTSYEGLGTVAGDTVHEVHPIDLGFILRSALGQPVSTNRTGSYKHVFTPAAHYLPAAQKGTATAGAATTITDTGQTWTVDLYIGYWVHIVSGTGSGQVRIITDNDATSLTVATWTTNPDNTSIYEIRPGPDNCILPPYTLEVHRDLSGVAAHAFQFKGMVANALAFTFGTGEKILGLTTSWLGKDVAALAPTTASMPATDPFRWNQCLIGIGRKETAAMTGATANTLTDTGIGWTVNEHAGRIVRVIDGTGVDQTRKIVSNTTEILTVTPNFTTTPAGTENYEIYYTPGTLETLNWGIDNGLVAVPKLNNTKRIAAIMGDAYRMGTVSPTLQVEDITDFSTYFTGWTTRKWIIWFLGANITGNHYYELEIEIPKVLFTAYPVGVGGPGRITVGATCKMKYDSTLKYIAKIRLFNNTSTYG